MEALPCKLLLDTDVFSYLCADAWIAATAVLNRVPLLTHNLKDYKDIDGLELLTPEAIL
jgi:hypothetical protein